MEKLSLKELRLLAKFSREEMSERYDIPIRSIQNWENEVRSCPSYVEKMIKEKLIKEILVAQIRYEKSFKDTGEEGFSCYIKDEETGEFIFSWFYMIDYMIDDNGMVSKEMIFRIKQMVKMGWRVIFIE